MPFRHPVLLLLTILGMVPALSDWFGTKAVGAEYEEVAAFERPPQKPAAPLLYVAADGNYYGTAPEGGAKNLGAIFRLTPLGASSIVVSFTGTSGTAKGATPLAGLTLGADGSLYGTTSAGGAFDCGTLFKVTTAGVFTTLVELNDNTAPKGIMPNGLTLGGDGNLYGTCQGGGSNSSGTIFRFNPTTSVFTTLYQFSGALLFGTGSTPMGSLVATGTGSITLYGVTQEGGTIGLSLLNCGTVFKFTVSGNGGSLNSLVVFGGSLPLLGQPGNSPSAGLCLHSDGFLYGTTEFGGTLLGQDLGTIFKVSTSGNYTLVKAFDETTGAEPAGELISSGGLLYGTTSSGGDNGLGTIFKITFPPPSSTPTHSVVASFTGKSGVAKGSEPRAALTLTPGGEFIGTTTSGGPGDLGTCFKVTTTGTFTNFLNFSTAGGWSPSGGPTVDATGALLVPLWQGGAASEGTLRRVQTNGVTTVETTFGSPLGEEPSGALLKVGTDYYGVTSDGGANGLGSFFKYTPGVGTVTLASCASAAQSSPEGPPVLGPDGFFYVAARGPGNGKGSILRIGANGSLSQFYSFTTTLGGLKPRGPVAFDANGNLYGATELGGSTGSPLGTLFKITPGGALTTLVDFVLTALKTPAGGLVAGADGNFYGMTTGSVALAGTSVFKVTPAGALSVLATFTGTTGAVPGSDPTGPLTIALDGTLYGITAHGGSDDKGTIFRLTPNGAGFTYSLLSSLMGSDDPALEDPSGLGLAFAPDGYLYGTSANGGSLGGGHLFRLKKLGPHAVTDAPLFAPGMVTFQGRSQTGGETTSVFFEYDTQQPPFQNTTTPANASANSSPASFSAGVSGLPAGTPIYYRAKATNPSGTSTGAIRNFVVPAPLVAWKLNVFGNSNVSDLADSDGDGVLNLVEYALLTSPVQGDIASGPAPILRTYAEGRRLSLTVQRDPARNDVVVEVLAADSPGGPWNAVATSDHGAPFVGAGYVSGDSLQSGIKTVEIRDTVNISDAPCRFLRVRVTH
jgi:uncharacterized repeat protein (TIGR03803 family)